MTLLAINGDSEAFTTLVELSFERTYALAFRLTQDRDDALDVVQDAYLRAYRSIGTFRGESAFETWLYRITANSALAYLGKRKKHRQSEEDEARQNTKHRVPANIYESGVLDSDRLAKALKELSPNLRAVIVLRDIYDLSHESVAKEIGISQSAAKVRLHRARRALREILERETLAKGELAEGR